MPREPEILKWADYWRVIADKRTPILVKKYLLDKASRECMLGLVEVILNVRENKIRLSPQLEKKVVHHKRTLLSLLFRKSAVNKQKTLLKRKNGLAVITELLPGLLAAVVVNSQNEEEATVVEEEVSGGENGSSASGCTRFQDCGPSVLQ